MANYTEGDFIPIEELEAGRAYRIDCRNLYVGFWNPATGGFIGIREKFGDRYLFTEYHWDQGAPYGTVRPRKALDIWAGDIPLQETVGLFCRYCETPVQQVWENPDGETPRDRGKRVGDTHVEQPTDCEGEGMYMAYWKSNKPLFDLLDELDQRISDAKNAEWKARMNALRNDA